MPGVLGLEWPSAKCAEEAAQLRWINRLHDVAVVGGRQGAHAVLRPSIRGERNRRCLPRELEAVAGRHGWVVVDLDHAISGKNGREKRPAFDRCSKVWHGRTST